MNKPKHLAHYSDEYFQDNFLSGVNKFMFGFADAGDTIKGNGYHFEFFGNFPTLRGAKLKAAESGGYVRSYLFGKLKRGWVVLKDI